MENSKEQIIIQEREYLDQVIKAVREGKAELDSLIERKRQNRKNISDRDRFIEAEVLKYNIRRAGELAKMAESPYFFKCLVRFEGAASDEEVLIGKFSLAEKQIYSWFSPVSRLRYEEVGDFSYEKPDGEIRRGLLQKKDQFMIADGRILYMASEAIGSARQLIYQEHLSNRKSGFVLPEVIERMEKSQDEVIRADYRGSYLISGPAGSGKTTLALHRVAYLAQSPDTAEMFPGQNILVFVQDETTLAYFKAIFPQLGIDEVVITTFPRWALGMLGLDDYSYTYRPGNNEADKNLYEYAKSRALEKALESLIISDIRQLDRYYSETLDNDSLIRWREQMAEQRLDRFDIAFLLLGRLRRDGALLKEERIAVRKKNGNYEMQNRLLPQKYALIIVDEVQNYLAADIRVLKSCLGQNKSILYTGDLAQKTKLFTISDWAQVGEDFQAGKRIVLDKVYRNTREILEYVRAQGYDVFIPAELRSGAPVVEKYFTSRAEELGYLESLIRSDERIIGIMHRDEEYLRLYKERFKDKANVHVLSITEAQGVEFDLAVLLIGDEPAIDYPDDVLARECEKAQQDLTYVALTRAMEEMHVIRLRGLQNS